MISPRPWSKRYPRSKPGAPVQSRGAVGNRTGSSTPATFTVPNSPFLMWTPTRFSSRAPNQPGAGAPGGQGRGAQGSGQAGGPPEPNGPVGRGMKAGGGWGTGAGAGLPRLTGGPVAGTGA